MTEEIIKLHARKCHIKDLSKDSKTIRNFLNDNHQQKWCRGNKVAIGLYYENELVQLMTFGKPRFNRNFDWEMIRECSKKNTVIRGGTSKLFKYFIKNHDPENIIVYTDVTNTHLMNDNDHYVKHLNFERLKNPRKAKIERWISEVFPREDGYGRDYSATSITHYGPDRMLGTKLGFNNGTNSEIMEKLGYKKVATYGMTPRVDFWYKKHFGYCYKIDCSCGAFYVGMSTKSDFHSIKNYKGSGKKWLSHLKKHPDHKQSKTVISYYENFEDLSNAELKLILDNIDNINCYNLKTDLQNTKPIKLPFCDDCKSSGAHKKTCSKFVVNVCSECGGKSRRHKKECSLFVPVPPCSECGGKSFQHKKTCSMFVAKVGVNCSECKSSSTVHKKSCSKFINSSGCDKCGSPAAHKKNCSKRIVYVFCDECGTKSNHKKECSKWTPLPACNFCGSRSTHKKWCEKYTNSDIDEVT